jgi:signal transduction histidine kinase
MDEIKKAQLRFRLFDDMPIGVCILKRDYTVLYWNDTIEDWTDILSENIIGKKLMEFFPKFNKFSYSILIDGIFDGGPPAIFSSQLHKSLFPSKTHDGEPRVQNTTVKAIPGESDEDFYALFSIEDVTGLTKRIKDYKAMRDQALEEIDNRIKVEIKLRQSEQELRELNATKDKFFSIMAHDLKNPIGSFLNLSEVLSTMFDDFSQEELKEYLEEMYSSSQHLFKLLENLLMWSRAQTGKIQVHKEQFDVKMIIDSNLSLLKLNADNKRIKFINNASDDSIVYADENMTNTVIRNLISNALKFTNIGGSITVNTIFDDDFVQVSIADTGVGMDQDVVEKLFRIDSNYTTRGTSDEKGTGLGLILCKEFVNKQEGEIWVDSEPGKGSTFIFTLPRYNEGTDQQ